MAKHFYIPIWVLLITVWCSVLNAQSFSFEKIGLEEGLPTARINAILSGPQGFTWMASEGAGLLRYDGHRFENYFQEEFPLITDLILDHEKTIFYFHDGRRLASYNGLELQPISFPEDQIKGMCLYQGGLYLAGEKALYSWNGDSMVLEQNLPFGLSRLQNIDQDLYAQTEAGIYRWNQDWELVDSANGARLFGSKARHFLSSGKLIPNQEDAFFPFVDSLVMAFEQADEGLYLSSQKLYWNYKTQWRSISVPSYIRQSGIKGLYVHGGVLLFSTNDGLYKLNTLALARFKRQLPLLSMSLWENSLFIGSPLGLEHIKEGRTKELIPMQGLVLSSLAVNSSVLVGTEAGLFEYQLASKSLIPTPVGGFVFSLCEANNEVWAAASSGIWHKEKGQWKLARSESELEGASVFSAKAFSNSGLWFASYTQGILRHKDGIWTAFRKPAGIALDSIGISAFQPLGGHRLAIGTLSNGLFIIDVERNSVDHYSLKDLDFAEIRALSLVGSALWMGTNKGLLSLNDVQQSRRAGESGALFFMGGPVNAQAMKSDGTKLYAAGEQGYIELDVQQLEKQALLGNMGILTAELLQEGSKNLNENNLAKEAFSLTPILEELDYQQNYLRFRYGFRTLFYPELAQYRYRLEGQKTDWTYTGTTREALFGDLKAGDYKFEVQARYPWQAWSSTAGTYAFKVKEAYWRTWWFWFLFAFVISGITFIWARDRWQRREKRLRLENDLLDMERKALRLQMNPHFIFNALDSISSFIFKKDPKMAVRYLNNFAKLMRLTLESSMEHIHPVETEVSILKNYLELEKLRFNAKFDYEIVVDEDLDYDIGLPPMLVQPHVENAILHGLKPKDGPGFIHISFKLDGEYLCCTIDDDGIGREKAKDLPGKKAHRSMATQINKDRIDLLKRSLDEDIYLNIIDKHNQQGESTGTTVIIRLPAQDF